MEAETPTPQIIHVPYTTLHGLTPVGSSASVHLLRRLPRVAVVGVDPAMAQEAAAIARLALQVAKVEPPRLRVLVELNLPEHATMTAGQLAFIIAVGLLAHDRSFSMPYPCSEEIDLNGKVRLGPVARVVRALGGDPFEGELSKLIEYRQAAAQLDARTIVRQKLPKLTELVKRAQAAHVPLIMPDGDPKLGPTVGTVAICARGNATDSRVAFAILGLDAPRTLPVRAPHYSISKAGMFGSRIGAHAYRPGETHLAAGGVLAIDDTPLWRKHVLQQLATVHRERKVDVGAGFRAPPFPTSFLLVIYADRHNPEELARLADIFPNALVYTGEEA